jgi:general secretion pathway protein D
MRVVRTIVLAMGIAIGAAAPSLAVAQVAPVAATPGDSVTIHLVDVDLRAAVQSLSRYLDRPVVFGAITGARVTLETPGPVPRAQVLSLLRGVLQSQNFELVSDSGLYRVQMKAAPAAGDQAAHPARPAGTVELFSIHLRHARAADVAATVNALYGHASAIGEIGAPPEMLGQSLRQDLIPPGQITSPGQQAPVIARAAVITGDIVIVPDPRSNSLLIRATAEDFELIQAAVKELDIRPLQVLIQVLIAEVRTNSSFFLGVDAKAGPFTNKNGTTTTATQASGTGVGDFVLQVMHLGGMDIDATLTAAASNGDVRILSRPVVVAANNQQAQILVGSQRPFIQVSRSLPTDAATRDQVVQYKEVGTKLIVRPTISPDGYVVLEVTQEVNLATNEIQFNAPVISSRQVQTQLLIKDGQTVALGGLTDRQQDHSQGGVPILSSIPWIGGLFGHVSNSSSQTELFLFLTPHVIRNDEEADSLSKPMLDKADKGKP